MRFLVDACVDIRVGEWLRGQGHDAVHLSEQGLQRLANGEIFRKAVAENRCVLTFDLDFSEIAALTGGSKGSVILIRLGDPGFRHVVDRLSAVLAESAAATKQSSQGTLQMPKHTYGTTKTARKKRVPASVPYEPGLIERLKNPREAAAYLEAAIEDGDESGLMLALRHVAQALGGVAALARKSRLTREATYRMLSASGNPELKSLAAILGAAGLRISVKPIEKRAA